MAIPRHEQPDFYLAATDVFRLDAPIEAWRLKIIRRDAASDNPSEPRNGAVRNEYLLIRIEPPFEVRGQPVNTVLLSAKDGSISWASIDRWPVFVFVLNPDVEDIESRAVIADDQFTVLEWAALFRSKEEASRYL